MRLWATANYCRAGIKSLRGTGIKNVEFGAEFEYNEKVAKKFTQRKLKGSEFFTQYTVKGEKVHNSCTFMVIHYFYRNLFTSFSMDFKISKSAFFDTFICISKLS